MKASRPSAPRIVGLVADDLTGACDAAASFADAGWHAELVLRGRPRSSGGERPVLYAINTDARHSAQHDAATLTSDAVRALADAGAERLYLKIDSTIRGSIPGQLLGAVGAWSTAASPASAVICPAFPVQGRTVRQGEVLVAGIPVTETAAASDPITPVRSAVMTDTVPGSRRGTLSEIGRVERLILDAETDADLDRIAGAVETAPASTIAVGSGGLAGALARRWSFEPSPSSTGHGRGTGVLVAVSSLHPVSQAQIAHLDGRLGDDDMIISTAHTSFTSATDAATALAAQVTEALAQHRFAALVLVGGDGASAVLAHLRAESVVVDSQILPGCALGMLVGGEADGLPIVTKSGGFGEPTTLSTLLSRLAPSPARAIFEKKATHD